jgi:hypothetical protein
MTATASINDVLRLLHGALESLDADFTLSDVEALGTLVHEAMSLDTRFFHDVDHALMVAGDVDAIEQLTGLFHDVVYLNVDGTFAPRIAPIVAPFVEHGAGGLQLNAAAWEENHHASMVASVFGVDPARAEDSARLKNELLSALVAALSLAPLLADAVVLQVAAGIEATIPFRPADAGGRSCTEQLHQRLHELSSNLALGLAVDDIDQLLRRAVNVCNRDLSGFAIRDTEAFLAQTWQLFAESNPVLARRRGFSFSDYRGSLISTLDFFQTLDAGDVFRSHAGTPDDEAISAMRARAHHNLSSGSDYLKMKLVGIAILEAIASLTGGDTLISLFMGPVRESRGHGDRLEDHLPGAKHGPRGTAGGNATVYQLLTEGRAGGGGFDMSDSPVTAYLYHRLGESRILELYPGVEAFNAGEVSAMGLLERVGVETVGEIVQACKMTAWTRAAPLDALMKELSG